MSNADVYKQMVQFWLKSLPITHDTEEASLQFEFLGEMVVAEAAILFGDDAQTAVNQVVKIFAEAWQDTYFTDSNKMPIANAVRYLHANAQQQFMAACQQGDMNDDSRSRLDAAFKHQ